IWSSVKKPAPQDIEGGGAPNVPAVAVKLWRVATFRGTTVIQPGRMTYVMGRYFSCSFWQSSSRNHSPVFVSNDWVVDQTIGEHFGRRLGSKPFYRVGGDALGSVESSDAPLQRANLLANLLVVALILWASLSSRTGFRRIRRRYDSRSRSAEAKSSR